MNGGGFFMLEDGIKKKVTARLLALVVIISMIASLTGCDEHKEQESGVTLVYEEHIMKGGFQKSDFFVTFIVNIDLV